MVAVQIPGSWNARAHELWLKGEKDAAIQLLLQSINAELANSPTGPMKQFSYYLFLLQDYKSAVPVIEQILLRTPDDLESKQNLAVCCSRLPDHLPRAIEIYNDLLTDTPDDFKVWDGLARCLYMTGQGPGASVAGAKSLALKDATSKPADLTWRVPEQTPREYAAGKTNVIAFSLFGANPRYLRGALHNILMAKEVYPGWVVRFYIDRTVPAEFAAVARRNGAEIVVRADHDSMLQKLCWRFDVANDPGVGYFLVRDADSVVSQREKLAVNAWLASERYFHVMRDWWTHSELILAGMWGGVAGALPSMADLQQNHRSGLLEIPSADQIFLRDMVWPFVRQSVYVHDRLFSPAGSHQFPGPVPSGNSHVGQDEFAARPVEQAEFLIARVGRLDCLRFTDQSTAKAAPETEANDRTSRAG